MPHLSVRPLPLFLLLLGTWAAPAFAADTAPAPEKSAASTADPVVFTAEILKVHHFVEGDYEYVAYIVEWKGHEVFVTSRSSAEQAPVLKVGDSLQCRMLPYAAKDSANAPTRVNFVVNTADAQEARRLEAVAEEVRRRRAAREAAAKAQRP